MRDSLDPGDLFLGRYRIHSPLGAGEFGTVYLAHDENLERDVALKRLNEKYRLPQNPELLPSEDRWRLQSMRTRFQRDARIAAGLGHRNIVTVHELHANDDAISMEYLAGGTLAGLLKGRRGRSDPWLPVAEAIRILTDVCLGVAEAHDNKILHRDLHPGNIGFAVERDGTVPKTLDWGLAHVPGSTLTVGQIANLMYGAPEQITNGTVDHRADIYSLGVVAFKMMTGRYYLDVPGIVPPGMPPETAICEIAPPRARTINPQIPTWLDELVDGMLAKAPDRRPSSMRVVLAELGVTTWTRPSAKEATALNPAKVVDEARKLVEDLEPDQALELLHKALSSDPDAVVLLDELARTYFHIKEYEEAAGFCRRILDLSPTHEAAFRRLGDAYQKLGKRQDALEVYERGLRLLPGAFRLVVGAGTSAYRLGQFDRASRYFEDALAIRDDRGVRALLAKCRENLASDE